MMEQALLFGFTASEITAFATLGTLLAMLTGGIATLVFRHNDRNPRPHVTVDLIEGPTADKGIYQVRVHNSSRVPIQVLSLELDHQLPYYFQQGGENAQRLLVAKEVSRILPEQALEMTVTVWRGGGALKGFELAVRYTRRGTAADWHVVSMFVRR